MPHLSQAAGWGRGAVGKEYGRGKSVLDDPGKKGPPPKFLVEDRGPKTGLPVNNW